MGLLGCACCYGLDGWCVVACYHCSILPPTAGITKVSTTSYWLSHFSAGGIDALLARVADNDALADVDLLEKARRERDPINAVEMGPFLQHCFVQLQAAQPGLVAALKPQLTPTQAAAMAPLLGS